MEAKQSTTPMSNSELTTLYNDRQRKRDALIEKLFKIILEEDENGFVLDDDEWDQDVDVDIDGGLYPDAQENVNKKYRKVFQLLTMFWWSTDRRKTLRQRAEMKAKWKNLLGTDFSALTKEVGLQ